MKNIRETLLFALIATGLILFSPRQDVVFAAIEESQYIRLFEDGRDFEICLDENNIFTGTYNISMDTVSLYYLEHKNLATNKRNTPFPDFSRSLPIILYINDSASTIYSGDGTSFSAKIYADSRHKSDEPGSYSSSELNLQKAQIMALGGD